MDKYKLIAPRNVGQALIKINCPHCGHFGVFEGIGGIDIYDESLALSFGQRKCPNPDCNGHIFIVLTMHGKTVRTYPAELISFNRERIPERIVKAFDEAIQCHGNRLFIAAAIMIRKTLEEVCQEKGASGKNLKDKVANLGTKIIIPKELLEGIDDLRLLGNDAAHVEAKVFEEIGDEEIRISIEFTADILKAIYQYENLLNRLRQLKKSS